jgi:hypothetical protein
MEKISFYLTYLGCLHVWRGKVHVVRAPRLSASVSAAHQTWGNAQLIFMHQIPLNSGSVSVWERKKRIGVREFFCVCDIVGEKSNF